MHNIVRLITGAIIPGIIVGLFMALAWQAGPIVDQMDNRSYVQPSFAECGTDEAVAHHTCVWDAQHQGNGLGTSLFIGEGGKVTLLPHHVAHFLLGLPNPPRTEYMPCVEGPDPVNCVWDGRHMTDGMGKSWFIGKSEQPWTIPHKVAHYLLGLDRQPR